MALKAGEYRTHGAVRNAAGHIAATSYVAANAATYFKANGFLRDADGRLVVIYA